MTSLNEERSHGPHTMALLSTVFLKNCHLRRLTEYLPVTLSILVSVIAEKWGRGVSIFAYVCKEEGSDNIRGETHKWQCERKMLMKMQSVAKRRGRQGWVGRAAERMSEDKADAKRQQVDKDMQEKKRRRGRGRGRG